MAAEQQITTYGIKSECTDNGLVWHLMRGVRRATDNFSFATWTDRISSFTDYREARAALRDAECTAWYAADCPPD